jgi:predicted nuclease of predicted toxin-antitoxin system
MKMKLKLDENLGISHLRFLRELGYPADRVHEEGLSGASDEAVWRRVCEEERFFIALDLGFADLRRFPPGSHPGILVLRIRSRGRNAVQEILSRITARYSFEDLKGCLVIADERKIRVRRPPSRLE